MTSEKKEIPNFHSKLIPTRCNNT